MFGKKRIAEMQKRIAEMQKMIDKRDAEIRVLSEIRKDLNEQIDSYEKMFEAIRRDVDTMPDGCKLGHQCQICEFGKVYRIGSYTITDLYICGKGESCQNFVLRSEGVEEVE